MKICILDAATLGKDIDISPLEKCGELVSYELTAKEQVESRIKEADVIITNKVQLNAENLKAAEQLKLIALTATGYNNVDVEYLKSKGIALANVAGYSTDSVAQHTFAMLFYLMEHLKAYDDYVKEKNYEKSQCFSYVAWPFNELCGKTLGIVGLGAIGKAVARIGEAFGMKAIYYSTSGRNNSASEYQRVELEELLKRSDVISIHAPLNAQTKGLIGYEEMSKMKKTAYLLNLGRGGIVKEEDLVKALNQNLFVACGLDVLENEPIQKDSPLYSVQDESKLLITPHIAWASVEARKRLIEEIVQNIEAYKIGEKRNRIV